MLSHSPIGLGKILRCHRKSKEFVQIMAQIGIIYKQFRKAFVDFRPKFGLFFISIAEVVKLFER